MTSSQATAGPISAVTASGRCRRNTRLTPRHGRRDGGAAPAAVTTTSVIAMAQLRSSFQALIHSE
jgi:hypothetical protein